jgi:acetyltransferase-like isoleucine patch superfamily enzyme
MKQSKISSNAIIDVSALIGSGTTIWHNVQIRDGVSIGSECTVGKDVYIGSGVEIGNNCKIQNGAQIYEPARIGDGVFIGPQVVLTNDRVPRAVTASGHLKLASDWNPVGVTIEMGASIGANSTCIAPIRIGKWAMVGAGSVVTRDIPNYALVVGNPAKQIGWVNEAGERLLAKGENVFQSPSTLLTYLVIDGQLEILRS